MDAERRLGEAVAPKPAPVFKDDCESLLVDRRLAIVGAGIMKNEPELS